MITFIIFNIFSQCRWATYATDAKETQSVQIKHNVEYVWLILCDHAHVSTSIEITHADMIF